MRQILHSKIVERSHTGRGSASIATISRDGEIVMTLQSSLLYLTRYLLLCVILDSWSSITTSALKTVLCFTFFKQNCWVLTVTFCCINCKTENNKNYVYIEFDSVYFRKIRIQFFSVWFWTTATYSFNVHLQINLFCLFTSLFDRFSWKLI